MCYCSKKKYKTSSSFYSIYRPMTETTEIQIVPPTRTHNQVLFSAITQRVQ